MKVLACGDIVACPGKMAVLQNIPLIKKRHNIDFIIANVDNVTNGYGITPKEAMEFFDLGIDVLTGGNHLFDQQEIIDFLSQESRILRACNLSKYTPGAGFNVYQTKNGNKKILVIHIMGQMMMPLIGDSPLIAMHKILNKYSIIGANSDAKNTNADKENAKNLDNSTTTANTTIVDAIIVDIHAQCAIEKLAISHYIDGLVSAAFGTHTHIPTSDNRILQKGTAYQTDIGMCGDYDSVIGMKKQQVIEKWLYNYSKKDIISADGTGTFCGLLLDINEETGLANSAQSIQVGGVLQKREVILKRS